MPDQRIVHGAAGAGDADASIMSAAPGALPIR